MDVLIEHQSKVKFDWGFGFPEFAEFTESIEIEITQMD